MKHSKPYPLRRLQKGMTLIEVIVVLAIIVIITSLVAVAVFPQFEKSKIDTAQIEINSIMNALDICYLRNKKYPSPNDGLRTLVADDCLKKLKNDPWDNPYVYVLEGGKPVVISYGADGAPGGEGNDADISSKDL